MVKIGITGSNGFIGKNLIERLSKIDDLEIRKFDRTKYTEDPAYLKQFLEGLDILYHIAGVNRPKDNAEFTSGNRSFTSDIVAVLTMLNQKTKIIYTSSAQADNPTNDYGISKREAENIIESYANRTKNYAYIYRLPNVFGKWCRPFYNSVVATFCYQINMHEPVTIHDRNHQIKLLHVDKVIDLFISHLDDVIIDNDIHCKYINQFPYTTITVGELADKITGYQDNQNIQLSDFNDFDKDLYKTFLSYTK